MENEKIKYASTGPTTMSVMNSSRSRKQNTMITSKDIKYTEDHNEGKS